MAVDRLRLSGSDDMGTQMSRVMDRLKKSEFTAYDSLGGTPVTGGHEIDMQVGIGVDRDKLVLFVSQVLDEENSNMVVRCTFSGEPLRINRFGEIRTLEDEVLARGAAPREMFRPDGFRTFTGEVGYMTSRAGRASKSNEDGCGWGVDLRPDAPREQLGVLHLISADGIGGAEGGERANKIFLETAINGFSEGWPVERVHEEAHRLMKSAGIERGGVSYIAAHISLEGVMRISQAGDERFLVVRGGDAASVHSIDQSEYSAEHGQEILTNAITGTYSGNGDPGYEDIRLDPGNVVVLASDGLWKFVSEDEVEDVVGGSSDPKEISQQLHELALSRMDPATDSGDNINILVYRHDRSAER